MSFEDLEVWKRSRAIAVELCKAIRACRDFGFRDQLTRSAISVPSNIAEGAERTGRAEFRQFLGYAKGSAGELRTQIMIGADLEYFSTADSERWINECTEISKMLHGLIRSLE